MDKLELKLKIRKGSTNKTEREYRDFIVNGKSLLEIFGDKDLVGTIGSFGKEADVKAANLRRCQSGNRKHLQDRTVICSTAIWPLRFQSL